MKLSRSVCSLAAILCCTATAGAEVLWTGDFETGDFSQWNGAREEDIDIVTDIVFQGMYAARFEIHAGAVFNGQQLRVQVTRNQARTGEGDDMYMAMYIYMPEDANFRNQIQYWESGMFRNNIDFWVMPKDGGGTSLNFGTGLLGQNEVWSTDLTIGEWHLIAHHVHWSQNEDEGEISVWYDGELVVDAINLATKPDGTDLFTQIGFHRTPHDPAIDVIYIDGVIEADSLDDIMALEVPNAMGMGGAGGAGGAETGGTGGASMEPMGGAGSGGDTGGMAGTAGGGGGAGMESSAIAGAAGAAAGGATSVAGSGGAPIAESTQSDSSGCQLPRTSRFGSAGLALIGALIALGRLRRSKRSN